MITHLVIPGVFLSSVALQVPLTPVGAIKAMHHSSQSPQKEDTGAEGA